MSSFRRNLKIKISVFNVPSITVNQKIKSNLIYIYTLYFRLCVLYTDAADDNAKYASKYKELRNIEKGFFDLLLG